MDELEISEEAQVEFDKIHDKCYKESKNGFDYKDMLKKALLEQIQLKINWNKAAQRQK